MDKKLPLETKIDELISENIENSTSAHKKKIDKLVESSKEIDKKLKKEKTKYSCITKKALMVPVESVIQFVLNWAKN